MKSLLGKGFLFLIIGGILLQVVEIFPNYSWGNRMLDTKIEYIEKYGLEPNCYFIGASNTYRHIDPSLFDRNCKDQEISSFNLASDGCYPTQNYYIVDNLLKGKEVPKYIFITINAYDPLPHTRYRSTKAKYFTSFKNYLNEMSYISNLDSSRVDKRELIEKYTVTLFDKYLKLNMRRDYIEYFTNSSNFGNSVIGLNKDGFKALPGPTTTSKRLIHNIPKANKAVEFRWRRLLESTDSNINSMTKPYNIGHLIRIQDLINKGDRLGCQIFFILPPKLFFLEDISEMYNLFKRINPANRIEMANPDLYPELYDVALKWDTGHYNASGASEYTKILVSEFNKLLSKQ